MKQTVGLFVLGIVIVNPGAAQDPSEREPAPLSVHDGIDQVVDLPTRFVAKPYARETAQFGHRACPTIYEDPRDGTRLRLIRTVSLIFTSLDGNKRMTREEAHGDYWIDAPNRYGLGLGRALRIDCVEATAIGVVDRFP